MEHNQIVQEITRYINSIGGLVKDWYIGITNNPDDRLFTEHSVRRDGHWIFSPAISSDHARTAETVLLRLGFDGGSGGGDASATFVYAYKKTALTTP